MDKNYPFLKNNDRVRTVKIIECIKLSRIAFDANQYTLANNYYQILLSEIKKTPNLNEIITFPNLKTLIYNLGLQKFYDHDYKAALLIFEQGTRFYPTDTGMSTMLKKNTCQSQQLICKNFHDFLIFCPSDKFQFCLKFCIFVFQFLEERGVIYAVDKIRN